MDLSTENALGLVNCAKAVSVRHSTSELSLSAMMTAEFCLISPSEIVDAEFVSKLIRVITCPAVNVPNSHTKSVVPSGFGVTVGSQLDGCIAAAASTQSAEFGIYVISSGSVSTILTLTASPAGTTPKASEVGARNH